MVSLHGILSNSLVISIYELVCHSHLDDPYLNGIYHSVHAPECFICSFINMQLL